MFYITNTLLIPHCTEILYVSICVCVCEGGRGHSQWVKNLCLVYASTVRWRSTGSVNGWIDTGIKGSLCMFAWMMASVGWGGVQWPLTNVWQLISG